MIFDFDSGRFGRRIMQDKEHQLQCDCVKWFRLQYPKLALNLFAIPNGGKRDKVTAARLNGEGVVAGVADLFLAVPTESWSGLFIEMKTTSRGSRQSRAQVEWQEAIEKYYRYAVCRTIDEFMFTVKKYLTRPVEDVQAYSFNTILVKPNVKP